MTDYQFVQEVADFLTLLKTEDSIPMRRIPQANEIIAEAKKRWVKLQNMPISLLNIKKQGGEQ